MCASRLAIGLLVVAVVGCKADTVEPDANLRVELRRNALGSIDIEVKGAPLNPRALEVEITIDSPAAYVIEDVKPAAGVALDSVRAQMRGANRAILFAGDKRGVRINKDGPAAQFELQPTGAPGSGTVRITRALVIGPDGSDLGATLGSAISIR